MGDDDRQLRKFDRNLSHARGLIRGAAYRTQINNQHHVMASESFPKPFDPVVIQFAAGMDAAEPGCLRKLKLYARKFPVGANLLKA